jgi:hypothetical protein
MGDDLGENERVVERSEQLKERCSSSRSGPSRSTSAPSSSATHQICRRRWIPSEWWRLDATRSRPWSGRSAPMNRRPRSSSARGDRSEPPRGGPTMSANCLPRHELSCRGPGCRQPGVLVWLCRFRRKPLVSQHQHHSGAAVGQCWWTWTSQNSGPYGSSPDRHLPVCGGAGCARSTATNLGTTNCAPKPSITVARPCTPTLRTIPGCSSDQDARQTAAAPGRGRRWRS